ncbi:uncharacterized protein UBRO_12723 [Ustilago bromivora]|uniref:Uncharacterized protein n=1 Tax=Ustilago bromivora TaxID=307758 RepID=A0A1K0H5M9_9BASI|nr:uncharacterized protein UBRO_12723 [Ustilago bromivora]
MAQRLEENKETLLLASHAGQTNNVCPPQWLGRLLNSVPALPLEAVPHNRPNHADLQGIIPDASLHPAMEACLHLINGDLYSAHFLVRKAQGGSRYLDWLHAILHKLEGDFRNAKMWYTDLGNNNVGAEDGMDEHQTPSEGGRERARKFVRFHEFWFVPATNGGAGERTAAKELDLQRSQSLPHALRLTAHQHTDLVFLASLASKAASSSALKSSDSIARENEKHHSSTTISEDKIKDSKSAFDANELQNLYAELQQDTRSQEAVGSLTKLELVWMLSSMVDDFGWRRFEMEETVQALKLESTPANRAVDKERKDKATNIVFNPGQGQRKF